MSFLIVALGLTSAVKADELLIDTKLHHLRAGTEREWSEFPEQAEASRLIVRFRSEANATEQALRLRQQDVKQQWRLSLNEKQLGRLVLDENDTVIYLAVSPGRLVAGENVLAIEQLNRTADDIRVGEIALDSRPLKVLISEATVELSVLDATPPTEPSLTPCRITIVNADGALVTTAAASNETLAVRPGVIYTADGRATFGLPAGEYTIYAGRGFEYGIDSVRLSIKPGDKVRKALSIRREVPTDGYVACDTHIHTLTHSGHGDASIGERMVTLAGEGIELPIATDHNRHIDYDAVARRHGVRRFFTPVIGNEVTTAVGHFNIFPVAKDAAIPEFQLKDGNGILDSIAVRTSAKVIVLNHPRDVHSGFRPFGAERHNAASGENAADWLMRAKAVELVNSGAQQTDVMQTYRDWFSLLNRGALFTPVGASDSHDVSRFIVGQARTYIRCRDDQPGEIDVNEAVRNFLAGRVLVSCGLLVEMTIDDKYGPGDIALASDAAQVAVRVLGPSWTTADKVTLYANGVAIREAAIRDNGRGGMKWSGEWKLPRFNHDVHLVAVATGPGVKALYWPIAKPYQAMSPVVERRVIGSTGAIWFDADGDGQRTSAFEYAKRLVEKHDGRAADVVRALAGYDQAVAIQAAGLLQAQGVSLDSADIRAAVNQAGPHVETGFTEFFAAWRASEVARTR
ncbi:MAG: CehA/McbA family metallohydrolase [Pirellulales bacterium]